MLLNQTKLILKNGIIQAESKFTSKTNKVNSSTHSLKPVFYIFYFSFIFNQEKQILVKIASMIPQCKSRGKILEKEKQQTNNNNNAKNKKKKKK